jgi:LacI family transcriptional regulator
MAIGAIASLWEHGLVVPKDMSVMGYDNITLSAFSSPPLTTMDSPIGPIGQRLCQMLLDRIGGQMPPEPQVVTVRSELLVRASTAPPCMC